MDNNTDSKIKETIKSAVDTDVSAERVEKREKRLDAELGYEALAVTSSMGMLGMEEQNANLLELALAEQLMRKRSLDDGDNDE